MNRVLIVIGAILVAVAVVAGIAYHLTAAPPAAAGANGYLGTLYEQCRAPCSPSVYREEAKLVDELTRKMAATGHFDDYASKGNHVACGWTGTKTQVQLITCTASGPGLPRSTSAAP
jgi:hypothetical protein